MHIMWRICGRHESKDDNLIIWSAIGGIKLGALFMLKLLCCLLPNGDDLIVRCETP